MNSDRSRAWPTRDALRIVALVAAAYLVLQLLWVGRSVFFITFLAVLFGLCISAGADVLARWRVPRLAAVLLIVVGSLGVLGGLLGIAAPRMAGELHELKTQLPVAVDQVETWVGAHYGGMLQALTPPADSSATSPASADTAAASTAGAPGLSLRQQLADQVSGLGANFFAVFSSTIAVLGGAILVLFVAIYVAVNPEMYHAGLMHLFPHRTRERAGEVLSEIATLLRRWLATQLVAMLVIGVVTTVVLLLLGVRAAIALGILAGLFEFVPYVGPIMSAIPAIAMGFLGGPELALYVALAYTLIQQAENHLLIPLLMKRGIALPPVVTIISQALMGLIFGFLGLLVAMPLVGAVTVAVKMLYVQDVVGDDVPLPE